MAMFFGGGPFASLVGRKIEQATDASLPSENWALNMEICDLINETEDGPKDAIKAIRKRLSQNATRNFTAIMYTLTVLETCVKNCHKKFLILACSKDFIQELVKLIGPKNDPPLAVQQKILGMIQSWADAFKQQPELCGVVQVYTDLKQKGIEFPMSGTDITAPVQTSQKTYPVKLGSTNIPLIVGSAALNSSSTLSPDQLGKLTSELRVVEGNMTVLSEMLGELVPGNEPECDLELLKELYTTCQAMQERLVELISQLSNDEITAELLRVNDGLNNLFLRYSRYEKNRKSISNGGKANEKALIDLNENGPNAVASINAHLSDLALTTAPNSCIRKEDEFDVFAQSRNVICETSTADVGSRDLNKDVSILPENSDSVNQPRQQINDSSILPVPDLIGMHLEQDFDEMAAWLGERQEESLSSSEFEKFLAERAAVAEALPSTAENNSPSTPSKRRTSDSMFAL